jgi:phosphoribosylanthranilate isomerase
MIIKVCGMREIENVEQLIAEAAPDLMGLIFYPLSKRYVEGVPVTPEFFQSLNQPKVGVFVNDSLDQIESKIQAYGLSHVQLHGNESPEYIEKLKTRTSVLIIKVFQIGRDWSWDQAQAFVGVADWFLFDTQTPQYGGSGKSFDWGILDTYPFEVPFLLSGGLEEGHIEALTSLASSIPSCIGVDINSRFEVKPGLKDIARVKTFIEKIRLDT